MFNFAHNVELGKGLGFGSRSKVNIFERGVNVPIDFLCGGTLECLELQLAGNSR